MTDYTDLQRAVRALLQGAQPPQGLDRHDAELLSDLKSWLEALDDLATESAVPSPDLPVRGAPMRADDPVAVMLGLVPDPNVQLDPVRLRTARTRAALDVAQIASRLNTREWDVTPAQVARWERTPAPMAPALLAALATVLQVQPSQLTQGAQADALAVLLDDERISTFIEDWAADIHQKPAQVKQQLHVALRTAGHRNATESSVIALLAVLRTLRQVPGFLR